VSVLSLDFGTSFLKACLFAADGRLLASVSEELNARTPRSGEVELDPEAGWDAACRAVRKTLLEAGVASSDVHAVCATGTTLVTVYDESGRALRPSICFGDMRLPPQEDIETILQSVGPERIAAAFGLRELDDHTLAIILSTLTSSKLLWLRANEPETYAHTRAAVTTGWELLNMRLTGTVSHQENPIEVETRISELFDVPRSWFGDQYRTGEVVGRVSGEAASRTGLPKGTPVVAGAWDSMCGFLGSGMTRPGIALNIAGTTDVLAVASRTGEPAGGGFVVRHIIPGLWVVTLSPIRGPTLDWFRDLLVDGERSYSEFDDLVAGAAPGSGGLLCLPYMSGEKGAVRDLDARGILLGLDVAHTRADLARAAVEGSILELRRILDGYEGAGLRVDEVRVSGGRARSRLWNQMKADILGRVVHVLAVPETGCLGSAILASVAIGVQSDLASGVDSMVHIAEAIVPDPDTVDLYAEVFDVYREMYQTNRGLLAGVARLRNRLL